MSVSKKLTILAIAVLNVAVAGLIFSACGGNGSPASSPSAANSNQAGANQAAGVAWGQPVAFKDTKTNVSAQITVDAPTKPLQVGDATHTAFSCKVTVDNSASAGQPDFPMGVTADHFVMYDSAGNQSKGQASQFENSSNGLVLPDAPAGQTHGYIVFEVLSRESPAYVQYTAASDVSPQTAIWGK